MRCLPDGQLETYCKQSVAHRSFYLEDDAVKGSAPILDTGLTDLSQAMLPRHYGSMPQPTSVTLTSQSIAHAKML